MLVCWAAVAVGALYPALGKSRVVPYCAMVLWLVGVATTIAAARASLLRVREVAQSARSAPINSGGFVQPWSGEV